MFSIQLKRLDFLILLCAALLLGHPEALAQSGMAPGAATRKFEEGSQAFDAGRFQEALRLLSSSMELEPSPNTRYLMARCYVALGKTATAYNHFKRAAQEADDRVSATNERRYAATRAAALAKVKELEAKVPRLSLLVPADAPSEYTVLLDGQAVPRPAWGTPIEVDPGQHQILASAPHYKRQQLSFELRPAEQRRLDIPLARMPTGALRIDLKNKPAGLAVSLDDNAVAPDEINKPQYLDVGSHRLVVRAPGYSDFEWKGFLQDGDEVVVPVALKAGGSGPPKWVTFVLGGTALAALAVGIAFGVKAQAAANEQQQFADPLLRSIAIQDSIRADAIVANVFFGVAGLLAINTAVVAATTKWGTRTSSKIDRQARRVPSFSIAPIITKDVHLPLLSLSRGF